MFYTVKGTLVIAALVLLCQSAVIADDEVSGDRSQLSGIKDYEKFANGQDVLLLAKDGKTDYSIYIDSQATAAEKFAAQTLADYLKRITGADFTVVNSVDGSTGRVIAVGPAAARQIAPDSVADFSMLGHDGIVIKAVGQNLVLSGAPGSRRGTVYAVITMLESTGCRWWSEGDTFVPQKQTLKIPMHNVQYRPVLNYRELFDYQMRNFPVCNKLNGNVYSIPENQGGKVGYRGPYYVHTFSLIVPPNEYFAQHPEWFAEIDGKRRAGDWDGKSSGHVNNCQLCLGNKDLLAFVTGKVKTYLKEAPPDSIVSISQSDGNGGKCQCGICAAIENEEGSPSGPILRFVNAVADAIKDEYPQARIDTLAYNYSQNPPLVTRPRDNVQIRLCAFNNRKLARYDSSANEKFHADLVAWGKLTPNIHIWDYTTDFENYVFPFPNLRVTAYNTRLFAGSHVKGIMQQGTNTAGGDMKDLKNWVFAKLLWDQTLDEKALIKEFVDGYYKEAAPYISKYLELLYSDEPMQQQYTRLTFLEQAYGLFVSGRNAVKNDTTRRRLELAFAPVLNSIMINWPFLRQECAGRQWPFPDTRAGIADEFVRICTENNVIYANEHKVSPQKWAEKYRMEQKAAKDAEEFKAVAPTDKLDIQDSSFRLHKKGICVNIIADAKASDGSAAAMSANHTDWAIQVDLPAMSANPGDSGKWKVYISARIIKLGDGKGTAFSAGVYDLQTKKVAATYVPSVGKCEGEEYKFHLIGSVVPGSKYIYIAPTKNTGNVKEILVDRIMLVRDNIEHAVYEEKK